MNWDNVIHKSARTKEGEPVGYIAFEDRDSIIVLSSYFREYRIPKFRVEAFDGSQVYLGYPFNELDQHKV